jgi:hypothetical protein
MHCVGKIECFFIVKVGGTYNFPFTVKELLLPNQNIVKFSRY